MARLFFAERAAARSGAGSGWDAFFADLPPGLATHPLARWLERKRPDLDWDENVCDMVCRYFGIPQKPLWPAERGNGYEAAAAALEAELGAEGRNP